MKINISRHKVAGGFRWVVSKGRGNTRQRSFWKSRAEAEAEADRLRAEVQDAGETWLTLDARERSRLMHLYSAASERGLDLAAVLTNPVPSGDGPTIGRVIAELLEVKRRAGRSRDYTDNLDLLLHQFCRGFETMRIGVVTLAQVESYLDSKNLESRSTLRARLSTLFRFAVRRGYRNDNPCARLEPVKRIKLPPAVFTVGQFKTCVDALQRSKPHPLKGIQPVCYRHALPWFILSTCCGLRPEEAEKTTKKEINFAEGWIKVEAQTTKVGMRRVVYPRLEAMAALKRSMKNGRLPLHPHARKRALLVMRDALGWKAWPKDVTRHTAASMWLATVRSAAEVAESLGNSERILNRDYKALVTRADADLFWQMVATL